MQASHKNSHSELQFQAPQNVVDVSIYHHTVRASDVPELLKGNAHLTEDMFLQNMVKEDKQDLFIFLYCVISKQKNQLQKINKVKKK